MDEKQNYILITGASSGIGRQIAVSLSENFNIVLNGRSSEKLTATKELCSKTHDQEIFPCDIGKAEELERVVSAFILQKNIAISHFIHCAGFMKMIPLKMINLETINNTFSINIFSAVLILKVLTNRKINNGALKSAVFVSSNISNFGAKAFSVYASSKAALDSIMRCLAIELAPKIRLNSVLPGAIKTGMTESIFTSRETLSKMEATYPLGFGNPGDVYNLVSFLISDEARWITGQQFTVDGGRTINISG